MYEVMKVGPANQVEGLVSSEIHQGVLIAHVSIACIKDKQAGILRQSLLELVKERRGRVALDLSNVKDFTCAWINVMLEVTRACRKENWDLAVFGLKGSARDILRATHLDRKMTICFGRDEALEKLGVEGRTMWEKLVGGLSHEGGAIPIQEGISSLSTSKAA